MIEKNKNKEMNACKEIIKPQDVWVTYNIVAQILLHVYNNQSLCNLQIDACQEEAAAKFDDEIVIHQFTKHWLAEMTYQHHLITYKHLE